MSASHAQRNPSGGQSRARGLAGFAAKVFVAAVLVGWLLRGGALDFKALGLLFARPSLGLASVAMVIAAVSIGALRYVVMLELAGVPIRLWRALQLQAAAVFFNLVIPGNVGGDLLKAFYVARDAPSDKRTSILLVAFVDRVVGLAALVILASLVVLARASTVLGDPLLRSLGFTVLLLGAGAVVGPTILILLIRRSGGRLDAWTGGTTRFARLFGQLVAGLRLLASRLSRLAIVLALAMLGHAAAITLFSALTDAVTEHDVPFTSIATLFPLGLLTVVLPVSPAGIGVGHMAFERLFLAAGLKGGATTFNVYLVGGMVPCLLGIFPYLALRRTGMATAAVAEGDAPTEVP